MNPHRAGAAMSLVLVLGACSSSSHKTTPTSSSASTGVSTTIIGTGTSSTSGPTTTTTTGSVPAAAVMLKVNGRKIIAVDGVGRDLKTLVTVFAGREVRNVSLMADGHTIWYATHAIDNQSCPEIVKLDLRTNVRSVMAHATDFSLTPDGSKLLVVFPQNNAAVGVSCGSSVLEHFDAAFVVRDLASGAESTFPFAAYPSAGSGGVGGPVWISPSGDRLIATSCVEDGCGTLDFAVPKNLGGPIVLLRGTTAPKCGCATIVSAPDGVYGVDEGTFSNRQTRLRRYGAAHLTGPGTVVVESKTIRLWSVVATSTGVLVLGSVGTSRVANLYRLDNGALQVVAAPAPDGAYFALHAVAANH